MERVNFKTSPFALQINNNSLNLNNKKSSNNPLQILGLATLGFLGLKLLPSLLRGFWTVGRAFQKLSLEPRALVFEHFFLYGALNAFLDGTFQKFSNHVDSRRIAFSFAFGGLVGILTPHITCLNGIQTARRLALTKALIYGEVEALPQALQLGMQEWGLIGLSDGALWGLIDPQIKTYKEWALQTAAAGAFGAFAGAIFGPLTDTLSLLPSFRNPALLASGRLLVLEGRTASLRDTSCMMTGGAQSSDLRVLEISKNVDDHWWAALENHINTQLQRPKHAKSNLRISTRNASEAELIQGGVEKIFFEYVQGRRPVSPLMQELGVMVSWEQGPETFFYSLSLQRSETGLFMRPYHHLPGQSAMDSRTATLQAWMHTAHTGGASRFEALLRRIGVKSGENPDLKVTFLLEGGRLTVATQGMKVEVEGAERDFFMSRLGWQESPSLPHPEAPKPATPSSPIKITKEVRWSELEQQAHEMDSRLGENVRAGWSVPMDDRHFIVTLEIYDEGGRLTAFIRWERLKLKVRENEIEAWKIFFERL